jgi:hypothetical protein
LRFSAVGHPRAPQKPETQTDPDLLSFMPMQYLRLVHLAERQREARPGREQLAMPGRFPVPDVLREEPGRGCAPLDNQNAFFTDGPFIETKEYLAGSITRSGTRIAKSDAVLDPVPFRV